MLIYDVLQTVDADTVSEIKNKLRSEYTANVGMVDIIILKLTTDKPSLDNSSIVTEMLTFDKHIKFYCESPDFKNNIDIVTLNIPHLLSTKYVDATEPKQEDPSGALLYNLAKIYIDDPSAQHITLKNILDNIDKSVVLKMLVDNYDEIDIPSYNSAIYEMQLLTNIKESSDTKIALDIVHELNETEPKHSTYVSVSGVKKNDEVSYSFTLTSWRELLSMRIVSNTLKHFTVDEIFTHCIWEATWNGYSNNDVLEKQEDMVDLLENAKYEFKKLDLNSLRKRNIKMAWKINNSRRSY